MKLRSFAFLRTALFGFVCAAGGLLVGERSFHSDRPDGAQRAPAAMAALDRLLPSVNFDHLPFDRAIDQLQNLSGCPIDAAVSEAARTTSTGGLKFAIKWRDRVRSFSFGANGLQIHS